jgi:IS30 family transposase
MSLSAIAKLINVSKSTVSREIKRNSNMYRHYVATDAQQFSEMRKSIPRRPGKLTKEDWQYIEQCLKRHWSPETIAGVRKRDGKRCVSVEWMYHIVRLDKERGGNLYTYLAGLVSRFAWLILSLPAAGLAAGRDGFVMFF